MADVTEGQNYQLRMQKLIAENSELKGWYGSHLSNMTYLKFCFTNRSVCQT